MLGSKGGATMAFRHVLVPTDLSEPGNHAVRYAVEEAALHRARVTLLHVLPADATTDVYYVSGASGSGPHAGLDPVAGGRLGASMASQPTVVRDDDSEGALTQLRDLVAQTFPGTADVEVAVGHPAETIVRIAQERGADLIVMSTHGRTGLQHVLLGSVAEKVVRLAPCPVMTVKYRKD
jgi:nucleotide-binding universal stress UspA family protein